MVTGGTVLHKVDREGAASLSTSKRAMMVGFAIKRLRFDPSSAA